MSDEVEKQVERAAKKPGWENRLHSFQRVPTAVERLMKYIKKDSNGCWIWTGKKNSFGYGRMDFWVGFGSERRKIYKKSHRVSWELFRGEIGGLNVLHKCDVRACCNPAHLFLGTQADNMRDMAIKGRARRGPLPPLPPQQQRTGDVCHGCQGTGDHCPDINCEANCHRCGGSGVA